MQTYKIEKDIPVGNKLQQTLSVMAPGDSFVIPLDGTKPTLLRSKVFSNARKLNLKVKTRCIDKTLRVWLQ